MNLFHKTIKERLEALVELMRKDYNKKRKTIEPFKKGDLVMPNRPNIQAKHRCKKLDDTMLRQFEVMSVGSNLQYRQLKLLESWKIHPTVNINFLEPYIGTDLNKLIIEIEADRDDWVMESILAIGSLDNYPTRHVLLVKRKDFSIQENTWETDDNVANNHLGLLEDSYASNPAVGKDGRFL
jgi:hypothetical protein